MWCGLRVVLAADESQLTYNICPVNLVRARLSGNGGRLCACSSSARGSAPWRGSCWC